MFFVKSDTYATVFGVEDKNTYVKGRISTSEKDQAGNYINSNWFVTFLGNAKDKARNLSDKDKIKITSCKLSNVAKEFNGEKKSFLNVAIFDFEPLANKKQNDDSDELPFN